MLSAFTSKTETDTGPKNAPGNFAGDIFNSFKWVGRYSKK